jgi:Tol biopolymer transport system component
MQKRFFLMLAVAAAVQAPQPAPEIFVTSFAPAGGKVTLGKPVNISNNPGYDNQPSFTPDGKSVLFTSVRGDRKPDPANAAQTGSDIYRYDVASGTLSQVTSTPESEYSPTDMGDGHISVIQVESDGTPRLWKFPLAGGAPRVILPDVRQIGYHAWADAGTLALFVLGAPGTRDPATLQLANVSSGKSEVIASGVGRSILKIPRGGISFVHVEDVNGAPRATVKELDPATKRVTALVPVMEGATALDLAWTPDGMLLAAHGGKLYGWRRGDAAFAVVADLDALGLRGVTRLAVSPAGDRLALVAQP